MIDMKKLLLLLLLPFSLFGAASGDFVVGIDLTGQSVITASQLHQLVNNGTIAFPKGGVIKTNDLPNLTNDPRMTNWLWLDSSTVPASLKSYVCCGNTATNWLSATIAALSVESSHLAPNAVIAGKVAANAINTSNIADNAVTDAKINAGSIVNSKLGLGAVSNANIAVGTITGDRIAPLTITDTNIAAGTITAGKLAGGILTNQIAGGPASYVLATPSGGGTAQWVNLVKSYSSNGIAIPTSAATATNAHTLGQIPDIIQMRLVCSSAEYGYNASDEVPLESLLVTATDRPFVTVSADANNWYLTAIGTSAAALRTRTNTFALMDITKANWRIKATFYKLTVP